MLLERPKAFKLADADLRSCMASLSMSGFCSAAVNVAALSRHQKVLHCQPLEHLVADIRETLSSLDEESILKVIQRLCVVLFQGLKLSSCGGRQLHQLIPFVQRVSQSVVITPFRSGLTLDVGHGFPFQAGQKTLMFFPSQPLACSR